MRRLPAVNLAPAVLAARQQRPEQHADSFGATRHALGLDPAIELLMPCVILPGGDRCAFSSANS